MDFGVQGGCELDTGRRFFMMTPSRCKILVDAEQIWSFVMSWLFIEITKAMSMWIILGSVLLSSWLGPPFGLEFGETKTCYGGMNFGRSGLPPWYWQPPQLQPPDVPFRWFPTTSAQANLNLWEFVMFASILSICFAFFGCGLKSELILPRRSWPQHQLLHLCAAELWEEAEPAVKQEPVDRCKSSGGVLGWVK